MSLASKPDRCPDCDSKNIIELARIEAGEFTPDDPPTDVAVYKCRFCGEEWEQ